MSRSSAVALAVTALVSAAVLCATSCANGKLDTGDSTGEIANGDGGDGGGDGSNGVPSACPTCDSDGDGVPDGTDACPGTPAGAKVNAVGCAASQLTPKLEPTFPPLGLAWTPTGDLGRAGGLTWTYSGIQRADKFHIWWILCDDPATPCGLSLDGPIDTPAEQWQLATADSDPGGGRLVFTIATKIAIDDAGTTNVTGRLTMTITESGGATIPFADVATLGVTTARDGKYGAEITGTGFVIKAIVEVLDGATWKPYLDYYDATATPAAGDAGGNATISFGGSFYDE